MNAPLSFGLVKRELAARGVTVQRTGHDDEVVVRLRGSPRGWGYFTDDLADALGTGVAMGAERAAQEQRGEAATMICGVLMRGEL
jgi:hypothetical protein